MHVLFQSERNYLSHLIRYTSQCLALLHFINIVCFDTGSQYVGQAGLEFIVIHLPLSLWSGGTKGVLHHAQPDCLF